MTLPLRVRLALVAAALVVAIVAVLGVFVYVQLQDELTGSVDDGLAERAADLIATPPAGPTVEIAASDIGDVFAAVLARDGSIQSASEGFPASAVTVVALTAGATPHSWEATVPSDEEPMAVRLYAAPLGDGRIAITGVAFDDQQATLDALRLDLALALPIAAVLAMLVGWYVGGAALQPVDRMRAEVAAISASEPERRLAVPGTGDELAALGVSLNAMLDRMQAALERERRLVDDASHELRTPLANLKAELDLALSRARTEPELLGALHSASVETDRLTRLAADLLVLARQHDGRLPLRLEEADLEVLAAQAVDAAAGRASVAGVAIGVDAPSGLRIRVDPARVRQALDNLLDNALRHTARGGRVALTVGRDGGNVAIRCIDTGSGFPAEFLERAFEPFARTADDRAVDPEGAGLGLAIVRAVAEAHGGRADASNRPGGGAVVSILLPL
jgi:heavy metal sensor kinase